MAEKDTADNKSITTNPCSGSPTWPEAPSPSKNPMTTMEWANGSEKDKFGCTRKDAAGKKKFHAGIDIKAAVGTDCYAVEDCKVESVGSGASLGSWVSISFTKDGKKYGVAYCHLQTGSAAVSEGDNVTAGTVLAKTGKSGNVGDDEPHLHLEIQDQVWVAYGDAASRSEHGINPNGWMS